MSSLRSIARLVVAVLIAAHAALAHADTEAVGLPAYGADDQQTSVSGLSSGGFMAVQLQVAYSRSIVGAGIVAGGPYYCAANSAAFAAICMGQVPFSPPNPVLMASAAKGFANSDVIDPLSNLARRRIYIFSGTDDSIVRQPAVDATVSFFQLAGVNSDNLHHVALHGCAQSAESVGNKFYADAGYNHWADSNNILVLYPQVNKSMFPPNPQGCWDWWGYTGANYAHRSGPQMKAITAMVKRLAQRP
jgi:poly(3-hydroxybutyrate) depolymerase